MKMDFQEVECEEMDWIDLGRKVGTCACGNEISGSIQHGECLTS